MSIQQPAGIRSARQRRYRVGDTVIFVVGADTVTGTIVEDRGAIGYDGRRIYGVSVDQSGDGSTYFEIADAQIQRKA